MERLFNDDETWSDEGLRLSLKFAELTRQILRDWPEYSVRDIEQVAYSGISEAILDAIINKRLGK